MNCMYENKIFSLKAEQWQLSMGMSQDFPIAVELNSDWVRIGTKLFT